MIKGKGVKGDISIQNSKFKIGKGDKEDKADKEDS
jgi:hypothetical protein